MVTLQLTPVLITARRSARSKFPLIISYNFPSLSTKDCIWRHFVLSISTAFWFLSENLRVSLSHLKENIYNMDMSVLFRVLNLLKFFYNVNVLIICTSAPNEGTNNWCHFLLRGFDFETFRDFFRLRDQKTSGAKARWHSPEGRPW